MGHAGSLIQAKLNKNQQRLNLHCASLVSKATVLQQTNFDDQIGSFMKGGGLKFLYQSRPNIWQLFGQFWRTSLLYKNCCGLSLGNLWNVFSIIFSNIWSHCYQLCHKQSLYFQANIYFSNVYLPTKTEDL